MPLTVDGEKLLLPLLLGKQQPVRTVYLALTSGDQDAANPPELNGGSYARAAIAYTDAKWPVAGSGTVSNGAVIAFPTATANWTAYTGFRLMSQQNGGVALASGRFNGSKVVANGDTETLPIGSIVFDFENT